MGDTARQKLREILDTAALRGASQVPLSNVKRLFRSVFQMELSETALGHAKLSELLQDDRFSDVCYVQLQDRGYAVIPVHPIQTDRSNFDDVVFGASMQQVTPRPHEAVKQQSLDVSMQSGRTKVPPLMLTPSPPRTLRRSMSMPTEVGDGKGTSTEVGEYVNSLDRILSHRSLDDSTCSTARDLNDDGGAHGGVRLLARFDSNISESGLRNLTRMDSNFSENSGWVSPHRGAGSELRDLLKRRLCKSEKTKEV